MLVMCTIHVDSIFHQHSPITVAFKAVYKSINETHYFSLLLQAKDICFIAKGYAVCERGVDARKKRNHKNFEKATT